MGKTQDQIQLAIPGGEFGQRRSADPASKAYWHITRPLSNWGRWARSGTAPQHCASFEWHYSAYRDAEDAREGKNGSGEVGLTIDKEDAERMEEAVCKLPRGYRGLIRDLYCFRLSARKISRRYRIRLRDLNAIHARVLGVLDGLYTSVCDRYAESVKTERNRRSLLLKKQGLLFASRLLNDRPSDEISSLPGCSSLEET